MVRLHSLIDGSSASDIRCSLAIPYVGRLRRRRCRRLADGDIIKYCWCDATLAANIQNLRARPSVRRAAAALSTPPSVGRRYFTATRRGQPLPMDTAGRTGDHRSRWQSFAKKRLWFAFTAARGVAASQARRRLVRFLLTTRCKLPQNVTSVPRWFVFRVIRTALLRISFIIFMWKKNFCRLISALSLINNKFYTLYLQKTKFSLVCTIKLLNLNQNQNKLKPENFRMFCR